MKVVTDNPGIEKFIEALEMDELTISSKRRALLQYALDTHGLKLGKNIELEDLIARIRKEEN